ncbi:Hypothetical protein A7982_11914 [Minicystis rosea]|nr:Hypothetical protein A7982_11914 [Minicystis rosea]
MWLEAIVTHADLVEMLAQLLPVKIHLQQEGDGDDNGRWLHLGPASKVELVAEEGLRVTCPAELHWTLAGVGPTLKLDALRVFLRPHVLEKHKGGTLEIGIEVEETDFHSLPELIDAAIAQAVNAALTTKRIPWIFSDTLARVVPLGTMLEPIEALKIEAPWGRIRIGEDALALVISIKLGLVRGD